MCKLILVTATRTHIVRNESNVYDTWIMTIHFLFQISYSSTFKDLLDT